MNSEIWGVFNFIIINILISFLLFGLLFLSQSFFSVIPFFQG